MSYGCGASLFWILNSCFKNEAQRLSDFPRVNRGAWAQGLENLERGPKLRVTSRILKKRNLIPNFRRQINLWTRTTTHSHSSKAVVPVTFTPSLSHIPHALGSADTNGASHRSLSCLHAFVCLLLLRIPSIHFCLLGENLLILKCPLSSDSFWLLCCPENNT